MKETISFIENSGNEPQTIGKPSEEDINTDQDPTRDGLSGIPGTGPGTGVPDEIPF